MRPRSTAAPAVELATRGVTPAVVQEAKSLLTLLQHVAPPTEVVPMEEQQAELDEAEAGASPATTGVSH